MFTNPHCHQWHPAAGTEPGPLGDVPEKRRSRGRVHAFPRENVIVSAGVVRYLDEPVYDSPCLLAERGAIPMV